MKVKDVMVAAVKTCSPNDDLNRAAQIMWENDCGVVPVVDPGDALVGMLTDRDCCMAAYTRGLPLSAIRVGDVMTRDPQSCRADDDGGSLGASMRSKRVRRLPVVDGSSRLVGIVSLSDLARRAAVDRASLDAVGAILAEICQPWKDPETKSPGAAKKEPVVLRPQRSR